MPLDGRQALVLESVRRFLRRTAHAHLLNLLEKIRPQDFPQVHQGLNEKEQMQLFRLLSTRNPELGASLLAELPLSEQLGTVKGLGSRVSARLVELCAEDDAATLLGDLDDELAREILEEMRPEEKAAVEQLLVFEEETAGRIMTPEVFSLPEETTVGEAIASLQALGDVEAAFYLYVVDERRHLVGVLSLRQLLLHPPATTLKGIMNTDMIVTSTDDDQEEVARLAAKYDLLAVPVVDERGRLAGVVTIDDVVDVLREEATEDIFMMAGTSGEERIEPSIWKSVRTRTPWLLATFFGGMLAAFVIDGFETTLASMVGLAAFIPVVLGMGGSAGNQTATVIIRGLATRRIDEGAMMSTFAREAGIASVLGAIYGSLLVGGSFLTFWFFQGFDPASALLPAVVIGVSLALSMVTSACVAALLPLGLHGLGVDPAIAATPLVTTMTDVMGSLIFLGLAAALLAS